MVMFDVSTRGVALGGSLVVVGSLLGAISGVVVEGNTMSGAPVITLSSWLISEIGCVSLWLLSTPSLRFA